MWLDRQAHTAPCDNVSSSRFFIFASVDSEQDSNDFLAPAAMKMAAQWGGAAAVGGAIGASAIASDRYSSMQDVMMDSGSLNLDDGDLLQFDEAPPDLINEPNYMPEQSMNLSTLLMDDDEFDADMAEKTAPQGPSMTEMAAPAAMVGGMAAMRAVYNRLRGNDDDLDEDTPGVQELMSQMPTPQPTTGPKGIPDGSRWAQMQQSLNHSVAQESTRGTTGFFMQTNA